MSIRTAPLSFARLSGGNLRSECNGTLWRSVSTSRAHRSDDMVDSPPSIGPVAGCAGDRPRKGGHRCPGSLLILFGPAFAPALHAIPKEMAQKKKRQTSSEAPRQVHRP